MWDGLSNEHWPWHPNLKVPTVGSNGTLSARMVLRWVDPNCMATKIANKDDHGYMLTALSRWSTVFVGRHSGQSLSSILCNYILEVRGFRLLRIILISQSFSYFRDVGRLQRKSDHTFKHKLILAERTLRRPKRMHATKFLREEYWLTFGKFEIVHVCNPNG